MDHLSYGSIWTHKIRNKGNDRRVPFIWQHSPLSPCEKILHFTQRDDIFYIRRNSMWTYTHYCFKYYRICLVSSINFIIWYMQGLFLCILFHLNTKTISCEFICEKRTKIYFFLMHFIWQKRFVKLCFLLLKKNLYLYKVYISFVCNINLFQA